MDKVSLKSGRARGEARELAACVRGGFLQGVVAVDGRALSNEQQSYRL